MIDLLLRRFLSILTPSEPPLDVQDRLRRLEKLEKEVPTLRLRVEALEEQAVNLKAVMQEWTTTV